MTVNVAHLVSWLSVYMIHPVWAGHFGRFMAVGPSAVSVHILPGLDHCPKRCLIPCQELLYCLLWHVLKIQRYRATTQRLGVVTQKKLYMNLLLGVDASADGRDVHWPLWLPVSNHTYQNLALNKCYFSDVDCAIQMHVRHWTRPFLCIGSGSVRLHESW